MQNLKNKIPGLITLIIVLFSQVAVAENDKDLLARADSLFQEKRYTQSLEIYHQLYDEKDIYTPQMLLKMAYIHEGLNDYSKALYFLNTYYLKTADEEVWDQMTKLAEKNKLTGYNFTDTDLWLNYYNKYYFQITLVTIALTVLLVALLIRQKRNEKPLYFPAASLILVLLILVYIVNSRDEQELGIINEGSTYLMAAPSAGASVVEVVKEGHRVAILGKEDVWIKILWNGTPAFIRENHLLVLE